MNRHAIQPYSPLPQSHRGSTVLAVLLFTIVIVSALVLYLRTATQEMLYAERTFALQKAINLAESGAEEAICSIHDKDWSQWTEVSSNRYHRAINFPGETDTVNVYVDKQNNSDIWLVSGAEIDLARGSLEKQILIRFNYRSMFQNGLTAKNRVVFNGNQVMVDSYDSSQGYYNTSTNRKDNGSVASVSVEVDSVVLQNADILGFVATGGQPPKVGPKGSVGGFDTPSGVKLDNNRVAMDFFADFPDVEMPNFSGAQTSIGSYYMGSSGTSSQYSLTDLNISSSNAIYVYGDVELEITNEMDIDGALVVMPNSSLTVYIKGDIDVGGNGMINYTSRPENMVIYGAGDGDDDQEIKLHGNAAMSGVVYAPNAELSLKGGGHSGAYYGAAIAESIKINGNYEFHYDESLKDFSPDENYQMVEWRELSSSSDRAPVDSPNDMLAYTF